MGRPETSTQCLEFANIDRLKTGHLATSTLYITVCVNMNRLVRVARLVASTHFHRDCVVREVTRCRSTRRQSFYIAKEHVFRCVDRIFFAYEWVESMPWRDGIGLILNPLAGAGKLLYVKK